MYCSEDTTECCLLFSHRELVRKSKKGAMHSVEALNVNIFCFINEGLVNASGYSSPFSWIHYFS